MKPIKSPYQDDLDRLSDDRSYFEYYDDLPASVAWMHTIGSALGNAFGVSVKPVSQEWEIDFKEKEMRCGSIESIYTRKGVLGLLLNGIGRLAFGIAFPTTTKEASTFAKSHGVLPKVAKHFGALSRIIDEIRTDDKIAHEYAGGDRVVDTMHAQAYEGAKEQLKMMAMDMRVRREAARAALEWLDNYMKIVKEVGQLGPKDVSTKRATEARKNAAALFKEGASTATKAAMEGVVWQSPWVQTEVMGKPAVQAANGRMDAVVLMAIYPAQTDTIVKTLVRAYDRNVMVFGQNRAYKASSPKDEKELIQAASKVHHNFEELKALASHEGGHAQYVLAKAEQYYHGKTLGVAMETPFFGYDAETRFLDVEAANDSARELADAWSITKDVGESLDLAKEILPIIEKYPFLDLNDRQKKENKKGKGQGQGNGSMSQRVAGAGKNQQPKQKREKEKEKQSAGERAMDRRKMEAMDNKENQKEVGDQRNGYSILSDTDTDPLKAYLYIIGPYLGRISATAAKLRRFLKVNDPLGMRGAYRRGKELNAKVLYRHRLDDHKLFARKEVEKDMNYGFALMGDLSGSTEVGYPGGGTRMVEDEVLASAFVIAEVAERIGDKIMCSIGFFTDGAETVKRPGFYLKRSKIVSEIGEHGGGTNVAAAGKALVADLQEMEDFKVKNKTIVFITDGGFSSHEFMETVKAAKKFNASIAYFQLMDNVQYGVEMCREVEAFVQANAKGVRVRTRNITLQAINTLPEAISQLMKETITAKI